MDAREVFDLYRALYSYKHVLSTFKNEPVKLLEVKISSDSEQQQQQQHAGLIIFCRKSKKLLVQCKDGGGCIEISKLLIGKKVMTPADFNNGFLRNIKEAERKFE
jgi:methionyl-tRNA formyltransferase